jgi:hypothetical protein
MRKKTKEIIGEVIRVIKIPANSTAKPGIPQCMPDLDAGISSLTIPMALKDNIKPSRIEAAKIKNKGTEMTRFIFNIDIKV